MKKETKKPYWTTPHGTKYNFINEEYGMVRAQIDFTVNLKRLLLFEEYCDATGKFFPILVKEAIWEKMDEEIRDGNIEEIGKYIKKEYLQKWDSSSKYSSSMNLQDPVD